MGAGDRMPGNGRTRAYARRASAGAAFALFPHDADLGVTGQGPTVEIAFEQAARAITAAITDAKVAETERVTLRCDAPDLELLLVTWLNAVIAEMAVRSMLFGRFRVRIDGTHLDAELWGEPIDPPRHAPACEPKGATCAMLEVRQDAEGLWHARCIIDV
jgi:tRNA nucleotidyltransferase (CCA-adding enzyme)